MKQLQVIRYLLCGASICAGARVRAEAVCPGDVRVTTCDELKGRIGRQKTFAIIYDGFTNKHNTMTRLGRSYENFDVDFVKVNVADNPDLRECVKQMGVTCFPSYVLFERGGKIAARPGNPNEDILKDVLNHALAKDPGNDIFYGNQLFQTAQSYFRNNVTQQILPTTFQDTFPAIQQIIPATFQQHFPARCWRMCPPGDTCPCATCGDSCCDDCCNSCTSGCGGGGCYGHAHYDHHGHHDFDHGHGYGHGYHSHGYGGCGSCGVQPHVESNHHHHTGGGAWAHGGQH